MSARGARVIEEAKRLYAAGRPNEAGDLLASLVDQLARDPAAAAERGVAIEMLLDLYFNQGRDAKLAKAFRRYVADYCEDKDERFDDAYLAGILATRTSPLPLRRRNRFLNLMRRFEQTLGLEGLVVECGCFRGLSSHLMCSRLKGNHPAFDGGGYQIFDSFQGLSPPRPEDAPGGAGGPHALDVQPGRFAARLEDVKRALAAFPGIEYFPGWIPDAFPKEGGGPCRFVHVDVDLYQPTKDALEHFWPRLVPGALMVCDDYNWPGGKRAVDEFCRARGIEPELTPTSQAVMRR
ncbi:MAG TPA: TylF/MycF/NovP-related O-methyltransferase [Burkholderiales bacterium]|nr:TylF/MycF/NovP-related O-methyltransferase [Burkholderiales bacterium]